MSGKQTDYKLVSVLFLLHFWAAQKSTPLGEMVLEGAPVVHGGPLSEPDLQAVQHPRHALV